MKPGASARPRASTSGPLASRSGPTATMRSPAIATSAPRGGAPVPSNSVAPRMTVSARDTSLLHRAVDDLHHVERLHPLLEVLRLDPVGEHRHAERARHGDDLGVGLQRLVGAQQVDPLVCRLLDPHATAAGAAAAPEVVVAVGNLLDLGAGCRQDVARLLVDVVETAVVARVVVDGALVESAVHLELAGLDQLLHQVGGMDHLVVATELGELVLDRV